MQQNTVTEPLLKSLGLQPNTSPKDFALLQIFTSRASNEQIATLTKAAKFGWQVSKIVYTQEHCAIALCTKDCAAWVLVNGKLDRAPVGRKLARLAGDWKDA